MPRLIKRGGRYSIRVRVPDELRPILKKREIWKSLGTADHREAADRCRVASVEIDAEFAEARRQATPPPSAQVADVELYQWARGWLYESERNAVSEAAKYADLDEGERAEFAQDLAIDAAHVLGKVRNHDPVDLSRAIEQIASRHGVSVLPGSREHQILDSLLRRAMVERKRRLRERVLGHPEYKVFDRFFAEIDSTKPGPAKPSLTVSALIERYASDPARKGLSKKTQDGYRIVFRVLQELLGPNTRITHIDRDDCRRVLDTLASTPPNAAKLFPKLTIEQAAQKAKAKGSATLHPRTVNSYMNNLSALFNYAVKEQAIAKNPAEGLHIALTAEQKRAGKRAFDIDQLNAIFSAPLYTGCKNDGSGYAKPGPKRPKRGRFWVPLLALFHGLRLNECCQLRTDDVSKVGNVDVLLIREQGQDQRVKTDSGLRYTPIHPELRRIGFMEFVAKMRKAGAERLFPELPIGANGYYSDPFNKWFNRGFLTSAKARKPGTSFHSFRHCYADAVRVAEMPLEYMRLLGGWNNQGAESEYGGKGVSLAAALLNSLSKVDYVGLDLWHLHQK
jgi:integrase